MIADDLSAEGEGSVYYPHFSKFLTDMTDNGTKGDTKHHKITPLLADGGTLEVRIVGINHDDKVDENGKVIGKAGLTFMATHRLPDKYKQQMYTSDTNANGWQGSPARAALNDSNGDVWKLMPPELVTAIEPVNKYTNNAGGASKDNPVIPPTQDKLWIPSYAELVPSVTNPDNWQNWKWMAQESSRQPNAQYDFFKGKVTNNWSGNDILKSMCLDSGLASGSGASFWWERSCYPDNAYNFVYCYTDGYPSSYNLASASLGVVLGFSI